MGKHTIWLREQIILPAGLECEDENRVLKSLPTYPILIRNASKTPLSLGSSEQPQQLISFYYKHQP